METTRLDTTTVRDNNNDSLRVQDGIILAEGAPPVLVEETWRTNLQLHWKVAVSGQVISLLIVCGGAAQSTLSLRCHLSAPAFTTGMYYVGLAFFLIPLYRRQHTRISQDDDDDDEQQQRDGVLRDRPSSQPTSGYRFLEVISLEAPAWVYTIMAVLDVYASYFAVLAFKYTTITSASLLTALAVPSTMILSYTILSRRYTAIHFLGVALCLSGIMVNVLQDYHDDTAKNASSSSVAVQYPHKFRGDVCAIIAGFLYGANDFLGEVAVRKLGGPNEYLGMVGFFATIICTFQTLIFERKETAAFFDNSNDECSTSSVAWLLVTFAGCNILSYAGGAHFLQVSEATFFNLSLQTGSFWSVVFSVLAEHIVPRPPFFAALVLTVAGVCVYEMAPSPVLEDREIIEREKMDHRRPEVSRSENGLEL